jgi:hypothetical protein
MERTRKFQDFRFTAQARPLIAVRTGRVLNVKIHHRFCLLLSYDPVSAVRGRFGENVSAKGLR